MKTSKWGWLVDLVFRLKNFTESELLSECHILQPDEDQSNIRKYLRELETVGVLKKEGDVFRLG